MYTAALQGVLAALCRTLAARFGLSAVGIYALEAEGCREVFAAGPLDTTTGQEVLRAARLAALRPQGLAPGQTRRVPPEAVMSDAAFAAIHTVGAAGAEPIGFLLVVDAGPRRLTARLHEALCDAAALVAPILQDTGFVPEGASVLLTPVPAVESPSGVPAPGANAALPRSSALQLLERLVEASETDVPLALLKVDIDSFRLINTALGPGAGDRLLGITAARLAACVGPRGRLIRLESDRFLIFARTGATEARQIARRAMAALRRPLVLAGQTVTMQASIGITVDRADGPTASRLMAQADTALRRAKAAGRNRFVLHEPRLDADAIDRSQLELDLQRALKAGQMMLVYQPYVELRSGTVSGVEALLRWRHPSRGEVAPSTFIPLAEASGLILSLGSWALRTACRAAAGWPGELTLAVNISALQFYEPHFVAEVLATLAVTRFPPERLELEITETVLMRDNPETIHQLEALIERGIRIAIDDFGTGYSALAYLNRLPYHRIKLDKSFVQDIRKPATAELIRAIIALARSNGAAVTAEGVECPEQLQAVVALGCTHAQGYATGQPVADPAKLLPTLNAG